MLSNPLKQLFKIATNGAVDVKSWDDLKNIPPEIHDKVAARAAAELGLKVFKPSKIFLSGVKATLANEIFEKIPYETWVKNFAFPVDIYAAALKSVFFDPFNAEFKKALEFALEKTVTVEVISFVDLQKIYISAESSGSDFKLEEESSEVGADFYETLSDHSSKAAKLVDTLIREAFLEEVSDIHLIPSSGGAQIKFRKFGELHDKGAIPSRFFKEISNRIKLMARLDIAHPFIAQDGSFRVEFQGAKRDVRVSVIPTPLGDSIVLRVLGSKSRCLTLEDLQLSDRDLDVVRKNLVKPSGIIIVAGPTGAGKTTTLYAMVNFLNDGKRKIVSVEDPIEYKLEGITQIQVSPSLTFESSLRQVLRHDPDVIFIGEIRDSASARIAAQAASTGHLVLSSLHAKSAINVVSRLKELGVSPSSLAATLNLVIFQRLVAAKSGERQAIFSVFELSRSIRDAIAAGESDDLIYERAKKLGFKSLFVVAKEFASRGIISEEEVRKCLDIEDQEQILKRRDKDLILLVEDSEEALTVLKALFEQRHFEVLTAKDGLDALEILSEVNPSIIITDLMMPRMSGLDFVKKVRQKNLSVPILMLTAVDTDENEIRSLELGADDFVSKGDDPKVIVARVERLLEKSEKFQTDFEKASKL